MPGRSPEMAYPVLDAGKGSLAFGRVEQEQAEIDLVEEQGMQQPIIGLACEVPQNGFAVCTVLAMAAKLFDDPELLAMRRRVLAEGAMGDAPP